MNKDRGIIKWMPFNSLVGQKKMIDNLIMEKQKIKKPILSLEQQNTIEEKIIEAFYEQIKITLKIYKDGTILTVTSKISSIDYTYKKIILENNNTLIFNQIIDVVL